MTEPPPTQGNARNCPDCEGLGWTLFAAFMADDEGPEPCERCKGTGREAVRCR